MLIAELIKSWRQKNEMTMQMLSSLTGIDQALISKYENGKRLPSEKHLLQLSTGMKIPLNLLKNDYLSDKITRLLQHNPQREAILTNAALLLQNQPKSTSKIDLSATSEKIDQQLIQLIPKQKSWYKLLPLAKTQVELFQQNVDWAFVFDCNRLTGNNLSYKETLQIISQNKTIAGKSFDEHLGAVNLNQTLLWIRQAANDKLILNKKLLIDVHILLYNGITNKEAGKYRSQNITQSSPPAFLVEKLMDEFFESMAIQQNNLHPLLLATQVFERIKSINPFAWGNEQMAQLMMNFVLLQHQYPLTTFGSDLQSSLTLNSALDEAQSDNTNEDLLLYIIDKVKAAFKVHLKLLT